MEVLAVIPARGGSKGVPGKNTRLLAAKPLIAYTIEAAAKAEFLDRIIVSTDSPEIARLGKLFGADVPFMRPPDLAADTTPMSPVIGHAVRYLEDTEGYKVDVVVTLQPTCPLRKPEHIDEAVDTLLNASHLDSVVSVGEVNHPPFWMIQIEGNRLFPFVNDGVDYSLMRRQDLPQLYRLNGAVYVTRMELLRDKGTLYSLYKEGNTGFIIMDEESSIDIDTLGDFLVAEALLHQRHEQAKGPA